MPQAVFRKSNSMDDASSEPAIMSFDLLREITNDFSEERKRGSGTFGKVYMGVHQDGEKIAVKKLYDMPGLDEENFQNEFKILTRLRHKNIVQLVGYCHDIQEEQVNHEGKLIIAERTHRALCLEYMSNGSLDKYLCDRCDKYDWHTDYGIIKGICEGLKYLHKEIKPPIYHLDLKPANVLLDKNMGPRIADFGMSRLFGDEQTRATKSFLGTHGYLPPEYIRKSLISNKFDIFSLGVVIIKIMAGREGYFNIDEMSSQQFINLVHQNWRNRLHETPSVSEAYSEQIKICIEIGLSCVQEDRHKRPTIQDIVNTLKNTETNCTYASRNDPSLMYQVIDYADQENLGNITQPGKYDPDHQQATPSRNTTSSSYNMEANRNTFPQHAQDPNDRHTEQIYHGSTFNQDILATSHSNCFEENAGPSEARLDGDSWNDYQEHTFDLDNSLPGIEGFQIVGDRRLGSTLRACGFPIYGTTLCNFQWVRWVCWLQDGTRQSIEGATIYDYVVTADDVGALLAVDCIPMDDNGQQGDLVREIGYYVTCEMQNDIDICISRGRADFDVFIMPMGRSPNEWEEAKLVLRRTGYQINFSHTDEVLIHEKYSTNLQTKIPTGRTTQFVLVSSGGVNLPFNTQGITEPNTEDNDVRLRDLIVLVLRTFQNKALLDAKRKGKARLRCVKQEIPL